MADRHARGQAVREEALLRGSPFLRLHASLPPKVKIDPNLQVHTMTTNEQFEALRSGASLLQFKVRPTRARILVRVGQNFLNADAFWAWPGVVGVSLCAAAEPIAQSHPGVPLAPLIDNWLRPDPGDQARALSVAARVLRCRETFPQVALRSECNGVSTQLFAAWCWPGVVRIVRCDNGEMVAESVPGQPFKQSHRRPPRCGSVTAHAARTSPHPHIGAFA